MVVVVLVGMEVKGIEGVVLVGMEVEVVEGVVV